jgi:serine/threonine protein kinase
MSAATDEKAKARVGSVLDDKWTLERLLGVGGMGGVYEARHRNGARAAIKVLHPDLARHEEVRLRFQREGYAANSVEHPGAVKVLDDDVITSGPDEGTAYIVMELLEGETLEDRLERGDLVGEREFLAIAEQVLEVLAAAHAHGVVHRDLKPENLFFARSEDGGPPRVKVLDFGLARLLAGQAITTHGLALGTPSYMSPEQASGRILDIDGRTDLFSLAATGFRLVAGRRIHEGDNAVELVTKMANLPAPKLREVAPRASPPFARVIDRGLEFRREDRYPTAEAMRQDVRRALEQLQAGDRATTPAPPPVRASVPIIELSSADLQSVAVERAQTKRRRSVLPWIALALWAIIALKLIADSRAETRAPRAAASAAASGETEVADPQAGASGSAVSSSPPAAASSVAPVATAAVAAAAAADSVVFEPTASAAESAAPETSASASAAESAAAEQGAASASGSAAAPASASASASAPVPVPVPVPAPGSASGSGSAEAAASAQPASTAARPVPPHKPPRNVHHVPHKHGR